MQRQRITDTERRAQLAEWIVSGRGAEARRRAGLTLTTAGKKCGGVTASAVYRWETGQATPRGRNVAAYFKFVSSLIDNETGR